MFCSAEANRSSDTVCCIWGRLRAQSIQPCGDGLAVGSRRRTR